MQLKIKKLDEKAVIPSFAKELDAEALLWLKNKGFNIKL